MAASELKLETKRELTPSEIEAVWRLLRIASEADGHPPLGEHRWVDLVQGGRGAHAGILATLPGHEHAPVGYAQVSGSPGNWSIDLVVHPHHRVRAHGPGPEPPDPLTVGLLNEALAEVARAGGGHVHLWVPKPTEVDDANARQAGLKQGRDLLQMRRSLPLEPELTAEARSFETRAFVPGEDDDQWLAVNNRAFSWHPEQGEWSPELLGARVAEEWFDATGFLLHEIGGRLAGFCWTKVHADLDPPLGEIYVIAVDPAFQGRGLGRLLTIAGLTHLADQGLPVGMLYVDSGNAPALALYRSLGFVLDHVDRAYVGDVPAAV